jgi:uncharacterized protein YkwD
MISIDSVGHFGFTDRFAYARDSLGAIVMGENIGYGYGTVGGFIQGWRNSEGHNAVLVNPKYLRHGLSVSKDSQGRNYATHILID